MINWDNFTCKACKRSYKEVNSFLENGVCIPCIQEALYYRSLGIVTDEQKALYIQKSKGTKVYQKKRQASLPRSSQTKKQKISLNKNFYFSIKKEKKNKREVKKSFDNY